MLLGLRVSADSMKATHRNVMTTYLSDWQFWVGIAEQSQRSATSIRQPTPKTFEALQSHTFDLSVMLRNLGSNLASLEGLVSPAERFHQAYSDSIVFLKAAYLFLRILLDSLAGAIEYLYKKHEGQNLPQSFHKMLNRQKTGKLPSDLSTILAQANAWFPELARRRDDLVHHYLSFLIIVRPHEDGTTVLDHYEMSSKYPIEDFGDIREYLGSALSGYQRLVDDLLDHFDAKFRDWYGITLTSALRNQTIMHGTSALVLWWAAKYGDYTHTELQIDE